MLLNKITVNNLGVFSGKYQIDLSPKQYKESTKPIIIFGGMNGSGKTTIFDSIKLCLYGAEAFPGKNATAYKKYLKEKVNHSNGRLIKPDFASVQLDFDFSTFGERATYEVERSWVLKGKNVNERLSIKRNGEPVDEVERDQWQAFIKEMLPIGLSQLFFFDGEKIQKMMHDDNNNELKQSIMTLLGLDLVQRLRADLQLYKRQINKKAADKEVKKEMQENETQLDKLTKEVRAITRVREDLEEDLRKLDEKIDATEKRIDAQGGAYFSRKEQLLTDKGEAEKNLEITKEKIKELASGLLPVAIASNWAVKLKEQIAMEEAIQNEQSSIKYMKSKLEALDKGKNFSSFIESLEGLDVKNKAALKKTMVKSLKERLLTGKSLDGSIIHGLSAFQASQNLDKIDRAIKTVPENIKDLSSKYEKQFRECQNAQTSLDAVPDESTVKPLYEKLGELKVQYGELTIKLRQTDEQLNSLTYKKTEIERKLGHLNDKTKGQEKQEAVKDLINKSDRVLDKFKKALSHNKVKQLEKEFTKIFLALHRKDDLISKIHIDPETFDVYVYDKYGTRINKNNLSSGELEMYAISMVWALARISGQKLPFAIDTPLARLDSKHRDNLINQFFPHASHQMLIFSTNTEVDEKYFKMLKPYVAKSYNISFIDDEKRSEIKEGYFWN